MRISDGMVVSFHDDFQKKEVKIIFRICVGIIHSELISTD